MAGITWGEFVESVYKKAEQMGINRDDLDRIEVPWISLFPDEGVKVTVRKSEDARLPKKPIYMVVS